MQDLDCTSGILRILIKCQPLLLCMKSLWLSLPWTCSITWFNTSFRVNLVACIASDVMKNDCFVIGTSSSWQMAPWYYLPYRLVQLMANVCTHHRLPYAPSGLGHHVAPADAGLVSCKCMTGLKKICHQPAVELIIYTHTGGLPGKPTLSNWLAEKQSRQNLIGIEWDRSVRQRSDFANVRARIWQNHWSTRDFWFSLLFRYQDQEGIGSGLNLDIARKREYLCRRKTAWRFLPLSWYWKVSR